MHCPNPGRHPNHAGQCATWRDNATAGSDPAPGNIILFAFLHRSSSVHHRLARFEARPARPHVTWLSTCSHGADQIVRRHFDPLRWGLAFRMLLEIRGVKRGQASSATKGHSQSDTVSDSAEEVGIDPRTARRRVAQADSYDKLPVKQRKAVDKGKITLREARREVEKPSPRRSIGG